MSDICSRGHALFDAYTRSDGRKDCRVCRETRNRVAREMRAAAHAPRRSWDAPPPMGSRNVPTVRSDDVVVVFSRDLATSLLPGLVTLARGQQNEVGRSAAWMARAIRAEMDGEVAHVGATRPD